MNKAAYTYLIIGGSIWTMLGVICKERQSCNFILLLTWINSEASHLGLSSLQFFHIFFLLSLSTIYVWNLHFVWALKFIRSINLSFLVCHNLNFHSFLIFQVLWLSKCAAICHGAWVQECIMYVAAFASFAILGSQF